MTRRQFLATSLAAASAAALGLQLGAEEAGGFRFDPTTNIIKAPKDPAI